MVTDHLQPVNLFGSETAAYTLTLALSLRERDLWSALSWRERG
jgi:hypothetical protein